jgi:hypothetical protein
MPPEVSSATLHYPDGLEQQEHYYDPLQPLAGPLQNVTPGTKKRPTKSKPSAITEEQAAETKRRRRNYDIYIRALIASGGDEITALAQTYGIEPKEVLANLDDYRADVAAGQSNLSVSDMLESSGIGKAARVGLLRRHAYDSDPKVSLVALKLAMDLDGDKHDRGTSYETYLRMVLGKEA